MAKLITEWVNEIRQAQTEDDAYTVISELLDIIYSEGHARGREHEQHKAPPATSTDAVCGAYAEYDGEGCVLPAGHEGNHESRQVASQHMTVPPKAQASQPQVDSDMDTLLTEDDIENLRDELGFNWSTPKGLSIALAIAAAQQAKTKRLMGVRSK